PTNANVLIYGESGTGKELIAHAIHYNSPRRDRRFVKVSCAALSQNLIETELFGHEKGSFTGAYTRRKGRFEVADGGTLFLDEVGEIPPEVQVKLLRVLQEHEFERVGGTETIKVDVRIISATNKDLWEEVRQGRFREDLFYRLNVVPIFVPPLRERKEDIPLLAKEFLKKYSLEMNKKIKKISKKAMELLMDYDWPGNVRELENTIERAVVFAKGEVITPDVLNLDHSPISGDGGRRTGTFNSSKSLYEREKSLISEVLEEANWNLARAARILQISRTTLYSKINKYGLRRPD
ncbi:MAG TPA: sigma-54-dependent Fis family transcriptional regulator, partial [Firmicutes bacterium]|nr:sigma-54-dependent Fis family transcriptional regulator [Bacillota bacterium]